MDVLDAPGWQLGIIDDSGESLASNVDETDEGSQNNPIPDFDEQAGPQAIARHQKGTLSIEHAATKRLRPFILTSQIRVVARDSQHTFRNKRR